MSTGTYEDHVDESRESNIVRTANPFGDLPAVSNGAMDVAKQREITEAQSAIILARQFPRNKAQAMDRILTAFQRPSLAEKAQYQYARGGSDIKGPSIRAAEAIAREWGNVHTGVREIDRGNGKSTVEAFAWDLEANWREARTFVVEHKRYTRKGTYALEDPRDIYELTANEGSRRKRACILALIDGDVVDAAMRQAEETLRTAVMRDPEKTIASLIEKFAVLGVTKLQLEQRIQRRIEAITPAQIVGLGRIYNSLVDGMSESAEWFEVPQAGPAAATSRADQLRQQTGIIVPAAEPAAPAAASGGPTDQEMLDAKVAEFVDATDGMSPADILAMVKRAAALRGIVEERDLGELYKRASGKIAFTKTALPQIVRAILDIPVPVEEAAAVAGTPDA